MAADTRTPEEVEADIELKKADLLIKRAELERTAAETRKAAAEAASEELYVESRRIDNDMRNIELDKRKEARQMELANDHYHRQYHFTGAVDDKSVENCMDRLGLWSRIDPGCDIEIIFNSPGGSVVPGMALFDYIMDLRRQGHRITTTALGMAASMAGILLQSGSVRRMSPESWVLIHEISGGVMGSFGQIEDRVKWVERVQDRILDIFAKRAADSGASRPISRRELKKNWSRTDWWISSSEALELGIVDELL